MLELIYCFSMALLVAVLGIVSAMLAALRAIDCAIQSLRRLV